MLAHLLHVTPLLGVTIFSNRPAAAQVPTVLTETLRGDVNLDGQITALDALAVLTTPVGKSLPPGYHALPNGDADGNGQLPALDALVILAYTVDKDTRQFRVGKTVVRTSVSPSPADLVVSQTQELRATVRGSKNSAVT